MKKNHILEKSFGPIGSSAGILLFFVGLFATYNSLYASVLILIGAFLGFSTQSTRIDVERKRMKYSSNLFGFIATGRWIAVEPNMKFDVKKSKKNWRGYSRGNRSLDIEQVDLRIILCDSTGKEIIPVKNAFSEEKARQEIEELYKLLEIRMI